MTLVDWVSGEPGAWGKLSEIRQLHYLANARTVLLMVHESARSMTCSDFATVETPVLVFGGSKTPAAFRVTNEKLLACLPKSAEYAVVPGAGHFWYASDASAGAERILQFLAKHPITR